MSDHIHALGAAVTVVLVSGTALVRWAVSPSTEGRQRVSAVLTDQTLADELLGPWQPDRPDGMPSARDWRDCLRCGQATAGLVYADGSFTCGQCTNHPTGVA
ncbi:hypothetical protein ABT215_11245 [Streptomyces sp900105755]|uniref:hypothetical protein n=1 Tax=Streptomyces sp. 900105755 TaxID=3154389 RepID=UPI00331B585A